MSREKKNSPKKARKTKSSGVWIAPDLERRIKGEGGRRGLVDAPYSYYLQLADLVLKPPSAAPTNNPPKPPKLTLGKPQIAKPPRLEPPKLPKGQPRPHLSLPKPPKRTR